MAKKAIQIQLPPASHIALPLQDYVPTIRLSIRTSWQSLWNQCVVDGNKLTQLKRSFGPWSSCSQRFRRLEISLSRLRISHTRLRLGHLICGQYQVRLSVFHVLVECPAYSVSCNRLFLSLMSVPPRPSLLFTFFKSVVHI